MEMFVYVKDNVMTPEPYTVNADFIQTSPDGMTIRLMRKSSVRDASGNELHSHEEAACYFVEEIEMITTGTPETAIKIWPRLS